MKELAAERARREAAGSFLKISMAGRVLHLQVDFQETVRDRVA